MASTESLRRVAAIFDELAELSVEDKHQALARLRESDPALEAAVKKLFEAETQLPPVESTRQAEAQQGRVFGPYRALSLIGQGGMGAVYLAERADGQYTRRAAIKVVHGSMVSADMRIRFFAERQILASLQHTGIASMLDGGVSEEGDPYLVMEYVDGLAVDLYADHNKLTVPQRLDLFLDICAAVDFAHRHLIIHRDLKPSNIFVDADGKPKLLDFGAAKLLAPTGSDQTKQFLTPRYASPEQMRGAPASVSMDVYALGVILYELVTGSWPFGDPADMAANLRRATGELSPDHPTTNITGEAAAARSTSAGALKRTLQGDLSAVMGKALETDLSMRYGSVAELAADVQRFRRDEPVLARPQTTLYRLRKWIARNPVQTAAATLAILGVLTGVALREQQRWVAEQRFDELRSLARFQLFDLQEQMSYYGAALPLRKATAERSLAALDQLARESAPSFELQADLTEGYIQMAELLGNPMRANLGETDQARKVLGRAKQMNEILQTMQGALKTKQIVQARYDLQEALFDSGTSRAPERAQKAAQSMQLLESALDIPSLSPAELSRLASLQLILHVNRNQTRGGVDPYSRDGSNLEKARRYIDRAMRKDPRDSASKLTSFQIGLQEANVLSSTDNAKGREKMLELLTSLDGIEVTDRVKFVRARALGSLGWLEGQMKLFEPAHEHIQQSVDGWRQLMDANPAQVNYRYEWTGALRDRSFVLEYAGKTQEAIAAMDEAVVEHQRSLDRSQNPVTARQLAELQGRMGKLLVTAGRIEEERMNIRKGKDSLLTMARRPDAGTGVLMMAARYLVEIPLVDCKRPAESLELARRGNSADPKDVTLLETLARAYAENGLRAEALETLQRLKAVLPPGNEAALLNFAKTEADVNLALTTLGK